MRRARVVIGLLLGGLAGCGRDAAPSDSELKLALDPEPAPPVPPAPPQPPREPRAPEQAPPAFVAFARQAAGMPATVTFRMGDGPRAMLTGPAADELVRVLARPSSYLDSGQPACTDEGLKIELTAGPATLVFTANCSRVFLAPDDGTQDALMSEAASDLIFVTWRQAASR